EAGHEVQPSLIAVQSLVQLLLAKATGAIAPPSQEALGVRATPKADEAAVIGTVLQNSEVAPDQIGIAIRHLHEMRREQDGGRLEFVPDAVVQRIEEEQIAVAVAEALDVRRSEQVTEEKWLECVAQLKRRIARTHGGKAGDVEIGSIEMNDLGSRQQ